MKFVLEFIVFQYSPEIVKYEINLFDLVALLAMFLSVYLVQSGTNNIILIVICYPDRTNQ